MKTTMHDTMTFLSDSLIKELKQMIKKALPQEVCIIIEEFHISGKAYTNSIEKNFTIRLGEDGTMEFDGTLWDDE